MHLSASDAFVCLLSDPEKPLPALPGTQLHEIVGKAREHGVGPIVLRKLSGHCASQILADLRAEVEITIGITLGLRAMAREANEFIDKRRLMAAVVKGPAYAARLYSSPADRPYTDLDILGTAEANRALAEFLKARGMHLSRHGAFDKTESNKEQKWVHADQPNLLVELHEDLVHYSGLRRRVGFSHAELMRIDPADPHAPLSLFFIAVVHAALGHKFHQLRLLVDVLQAWRRLDDRDRQAIPAKAADLRLGLEVTQCLRLIAGLFGETDAGIFASSVMASDASQKLGAALVTPKTVMDAPFAANSRLRRHVFRFLQLAVPR